MARIARLCLKEQRSRPSPILDRATSRSCSRRRHSVGRRHQDTLRQHDPGQRPASFSRQPRTGATYQVDRPLERDGDGCESQQENRKTRWFWRWCWRSHFDVRFSGNALRNRFQPLFPRPWRRRLQRRHDFLPRPRVTRNVQSCFHGRTLERRQP